MSKLLILRGIPGSGKSTWARKFVKDKSDTWVIVNRDSIRSMLGKYWVPRRESLVTRIEVDTVQTALERGYNVIIDATNLRNTSAWEILVNNLVYVFPNLVEPTIEYKDFPITLWKAVWRDFVRGLLGGRKVGYKVIKKFYDRQKSN